MGPPRTGCPGQEGPPAKREDATNAISRRIPASVTDNMLEELPRLEEELYRPATRRDAARMRALLHPGFEEIGRSGRRYSREDVLRESSSGAGRGAIRAEQFAVSEVGDGAALLTYMSAHVDAAGNRSRLTLRSSLWIQTAAGWQMRFHQGTPVAEGVGASSGSSYLRG